MSEVVITKDNFQAEVLDSDIPVLVDFWATWCGPCRMLAPVVAKIAEKFDGRIKVGKVNVDDEQQLAIRFNVASIPTLILYKDGAEFKKFIGVQQIETLLNAFK